MSTRSARQFITDLVSDTKLVEKPYRAMHSVRGSGDVRRVGRAEVLIGLAIGALALLIRLLARS